MRLLQIRHFLIMMLYSKSSLLEIQVNIFVSILIPISFYKNYFKSTFYNVLTQYMDVGIGKSCVLKRLVDNEFKEDHDVTVGVEFGSFLIKVEDKILKL